MIWTPAIKKPFTLPQLKVFIDNLDFSNWKPSLIVWHNTSLPTIVQWEKTAEEDIAKGLVPGTTRINNLEGFFRDNQGWSAGPHFFVWQDVVWAFTPANKKGTHSPSWNGFSIGIEMIADFSIEDDENGFGLKIKNNTIALTAMLCEKLGLRPESGEVVSIKPLKTTGSIFLHKQDPKTNHDCPGSHIAVDKEKMIEAVLEYMGHGGEHTNEPVILKTRIGTVNVSVNDYLNMREKSSASANIIVKLAPQETVAILNEAMNSSTKWFFVSNKNNVRGWVAAKFIKEI